MKRSLTVRHGQRWIGLGIFSLSLASFTGCSQFRALKRSDSPKLGATAQSTTDPYLAIHQPAASEKLKPSDSPDLPTSPRDTLGHDNLGLARGNTLSRSTLHPSPLVEASHADDSSSSLAVTLEPPISMPPAASPAPAVAAKPIATKPVAAKPMEDARSVIAASRAKLDRMTSYQVSINRQERVGETLQPAEDVLLSIRRQPSAVRLEWPSGSHKGREVIYSASDPSGLMYVNAADSVLPVPRLSMLPTSPLVMRNSRHPITEAGFDTILRHIEEHLGSKDPASRNAYEGIETPGAVGRPCHKLTRQTAEGERWVVFIDKELAFPTLVEATDPAGNLLERYIFRDVRPNPLELASNDAFDPDKRWGASTGFLGRLARSAGGDAKSTANTQRR